MIGVSKFYNKKPILKDIYLSYFYGAKIGVVGLNGSGKAPFCESWPEWIRTSTARPLSRPAIPSGFSNRNRSWTSPGRCGKSSSRDFRKQSIC